MIRAGHLVLFASLSLSACTGNSASTTAPASTAAAGSSETFAGAVGPEGSSFYSFTVATTGTVSVTLESLMAGRTGPAADAVITLGLGVPVGTGCSVTATVDTTPALTAQLTAPVTPDVYCVEVRDNGTLTEPLDFTVRILDR